MIRIPGDRDDGAQELYVGTIYIKQTLYNDVMYPGDPVSLCWILLSIPKLIPQACVTFAAV